MTINNLKRYEADLDRLLSEGHLLLTAMHAEQYPDELKKHLGEGHAAFVKKLPKFKTDYQRWYSEAKVVVKQIIPDRLDDFVRHYERHHGRKRMQWDNYTIEDYLQGLSVGETVPMRAGISRMEQQQSILQSAKQRFKSSLFDIQQLLAADLFDSELSAARALAKNGFVRAAGAVAGVLLEKHLRQVCENHSIKVTKKNPSIGDLNNLLKEAGVIDTPRWRATQHLADIRNLCDHDKEREPTKDQVQDLMDGVEKALKTLF